MRESDERLAESVGLDAVRNMTAAMLEAADNGRWTEVQRIDEARSRVLHALPAATFESADDAVRDLLKDALAATRLIESRIARERDRLATELQGSKRRRSAARIYATAAG